MSIAEQAVMFFEHGQSCRAVSIYKKLVAETPSVENLTMLAELYMLQGLTEDAIDLHLQMAKSTTRSTGVVQ